MRGKLPDANEAAAAAAITPAHAGKTLILPLTVFCCWDHPRACGENCLINAVCNALIGSPPRMRGKPQSRPQGEGEQRITPAHAGKTPLLFSIAWRNRDHPRACGENAILRTKILEMIGSPPRMRGKRYKVWDAYTFDGITPAHAGKTSCSCSCSNGAGDHPRACGENLFGSSC